MNQKYDFEELKKTIKDSPFKDQLRKLVEARTTYLQNINPSRIEFFEVPFDEKCNLEINKIKELMKIDMT